MSSFNVEKYVPTINSILRVSDLSTISAKRIRHALAQEFPNDEIAENKSTLDKRILECFSVIRDEREGASSSEENSRVASRPTQDLLQSDLNHPSPMPPKRKIPHTQTVSSASAAKKHRPTPSVAKPKPPRRTEPYDSDEDARFAAELDMALNSVPVRKTRGAASGTKSKPRQQRKKRGKGDGEDGEPKKKRTPNPNSAFNAPMLLSPQLQDIVNEAELSRPQVVSKLWEYIKANNLQNPDNRREILCDAKLYPLFNVDKIHMFTMNKVLSNHLWAKTDVIGGDSSIQKSVKVVKSADSPSSRASSVPKRNGKHVKSEAVVKSDSDEHDESAGEVSDESRFSDSEEDR